MVDSGGKLVDYVCVVGLGGNDVCSQNVQSSVIQSPKLLKRYPAFDHEHFKLPKNIANFCQPDGSKVVLSKSGKTKESTVFAFILTDKDSGVTTYGVSLNFYRKIKDSKKSRKAIPFPDEPPPNGLCRIMSSDSAFSSDHRRPESECEDHGQERNSNPRSNLSKVKSPKPSVSRRKATLRKEPQVQRGAASNDSDESLNAVRTRPKRSEKGERFYGLTSLCIISHYQFFSKFRECLNILKRLIEEMLSPHMAHRSSLRGARKRKPFSSWDLLLKCVTRSSHGKNDISFQSVNVRSVESWIENLINCGVPVPGQIKLELDLLPGIQSSSNLNLTFALPDKTRFSFCDFPLHLPLELLGVEIYIKVLVLVLLEKKIVVQSQDYSALTFCILAFTRLIYPLEYVFPIIPLLPSCMPGSEQLLLAPTPFIIGITDEFMNQKQLRRIPNDIWLVQLDCANIVPPDGSSLDDLPPLPQPEAATLAFHLKQVVDSIAIQPIRNLEEMTAESLAKMTRNVSLESSLPSGGFSQPFIYGNDVDSIDVATRVAMVNFLISPNTLANFSHHTRVIRLLPRPIVAIKHQAFINSREKDGSFVRQLAAAQSVQCFAEWCIFPNNMAYQQIENGVYDPTVIGDKQKWIRNDCCKVEKVTLWNESLGLRSLRAADEPATEESGTNSDVATASKSSSCSSFSDFEVTVETPGIIVNRSEEEVESLIRREETDFQSMSSELMVVRGSEIYFKTEFPNSHQVEVDSDNSLCSNSHGNGKILSSATAPFCKVGKPSHLASATPGVRSDNRQQRPRSFSHSNVSCDSPTVHNVFEYCDNSAFPLVNESFPLTRTQSNASNISSLSQTTQDLFLSISSDITGLASHSNSMFGLMGFRKAGRKSRGRKAIDKHYIDSPTRQKLRELSSSYEENQTFVKEIIQRLVLGEGISWLKSGRLRRLMELEHYRLMTLRLLQKGTSHNRTKCDHVSDVFVEKNVWKGIIKLIHFVLDGIESSHKCQLGERIGSLYHFLEIAHTHFTILDVPSDVSNGEKTGSTEDCASSATSDCENCSHNLHPSNGSAVNAKFFPKLSKKTKRNGKYRFHSGRPRITDAEVVNDRAYFFEGLLSPANTTGSGERRGSITLSALGGNGARQQALWTDMQFWEALLYDAVAEERCILHIDAKSAELKERFGQLGQQEKKRFEDEEDKLLSIMVYNLAAYMVMLRVKKNEIKRLIRRLIGKCHISITWCEELNILLDSIDALTGNDIDLKPLPSKDIRLQSFPVTCSHMEMCKMLDVCEDCLVLKSTEGEEIGHYKYESIVNMTFSPKNKIICIWHRAEGRTEHQKFRSKKSKELYHCIKGAMEFAAAKAKDAKIPTMELGGEFPVEDLVTGEGGLLQVCMEGIGVLFVDRKIFIHLENIRRCHTQKGGIFVLEEFGEAKNLNTCFPSFEDFGCFQILTDETSFYIATGLTWQIRFATPCYACFPTWL